MPTTRGRNHDDAASGTSPRRANTNPNRALSAARRMSIGKVMVTPTPTAGPFTAAITGLVDRKMRNATRPPSSRCTSVVSQQLRVVERRATRAEIGAGAEASAATGHHDDAHIVVRIRAVERVR